SAADLLRRSFHHSLRVEPAHRSKRRRPRGDEMAMRKHLCGPAAFVTITLTTGLAAVQASAETGLKLGITGFYRGAARAVVGSAPPDPGFPLDGTAGFGDFGRSSGGFRQELRIDFTGRTTLDNGLTLGVLIGFNGENLAAAGGTATPAGQSWVGLQGR